MSLLYDFNSLALLDSAIAGGKGTNLAKLTQGGFPVPPGFVLSPDAYITFISGHPEFEHLVRSLPIHDTAELEAASHTLCQVMENWDVPESVRLEVKAALNRHDANAAYSIRSSATAEDMGGAAFAGQHETYLNCIGIDEIVRRIRDCWISLWSGRAISYRLNAGIELLNTEMAVVVQKMAFNRVAGVGFCMNPVTGNPAEQSIDANYGLGESVVGGEYPIDHWVLDKQTSQIKEVAIAEKSQQIVGDAQGTQIIDIDEALVDKPCLSDSELSALSKLMRDIEKYYGYPQDIEWGIEGDRLWLLQARPVTRIPPRWTRDESAERFPAVITPLAWDLVEDGFHQSLSHSFELMGLPPYHGKWFALFDNYVYGNQNAVEIYAEGTAKSLNVGSLQELLKALPMLRKRYAWVQDLPLSWSRDLDRYLQGIGELMAEDLTQKSVPELWDYVLRVKQLGAEYFLPNIAISITQRTLYKLVFSILEATIGKDKAATYFDTLLAFCETKTGFINKEMYRLARQINKHPKLVNALRETDSKTFLDIKGFSPYPDIDRTFSRFLHDHGHREVDFDPYHPTWSEAPWLVVENIKVMIDSELDDPAEKERELKIAMTTTEHQLVSGLPEELSFPVQELLRLARVYTSLDDIEHYQTTRLTLPFRKGLKALGTRLVQKGLIEQAMDVFFSTAKDMHDATQINSEDAWQQWAEKIKAGKTAYLTNRQRSPDWELGKREKLEVSDSCLQGLPGSPGVTTGIVHKIFSPDDFSDFPQGAVLVARTTNPAWTPLFYKASAVITESGGPLSHGAVTAREVGLPAVMSVRGVLNLIENGQSVRVDGTSGVIYLE